MKRPVWILHVFVIGLALHNLAMAELYAAHVRGSALDVVSAWKDVLLAVGLLLVWRARGWSLRFHPALVDWLALGYGALVVLSAVVPQHWLGGGATHRGVVLGVRHDLLPVAAYFFGRGLDLSALDVRRLGVTILGSASVVAAFGLIDVYAIPLSWWRGSGAPGWFTNQLGFTYNGLSGLPENFVYNTGNGHVLRRLVSVFLSPLAASYMFVTALLLAAAWFLQLRPRLAVWIPTVALIYAGLLWTHSRSSYIALALGFVVFAVLRPHARVWLVGAAVLVVVTGLAFVKAYPHIGPKTSFTKTELQQQELNARKPGAGPAVGGSGLEDASTSSHLKSLRDGIETVLRHPQGYGPGNAGSTAARTNVEIKAGESTYTELGVDAGLAGGLLFVAWMLAVLRRLFRCTAWLSGALVAMLALALQTDIIGVPWVVLVLWPLAGWRVSHPETGGRAVSRMSDLRYAGSGLPLNRCGSPSSTSAWPFSCSASSASRSSTAAAPATPCRRCSASASLTPGSLNPDVTQPTIGSTICVRGWTATVRPPSSYTSQLKLEQMPEYGETGPPSGYQEDHLISLELGGNPTDPANLWPEPYPRAADVDKIENELNAKVCSGELTLAEAQHDESALKHEHG